MIVKNEERCLERCLNSVQNIVSEIIIVDTGSTDRTIEIAKQFTDKIYSFEWINDFSAARNFALDHATGEYILHLDADEYLYEGTECLQEELDKSYYFLRIRNELGQGRAQTHLFVRLFRNQPSMRYEGKLHEQINLDTNGHLPFGFMDCVIYHDGYMDEVVKDKNKSKRNMDIIKAAIKTSPTSFNYYNLGLQYVHEKNYKEAVEAFKKSFSLANNQTFTPRMLILLFNSLLELKQYKQAMDVAADSTLLYPDSPNMEYGLGNVYQKMGFAEDAKLCFERCLEIGEEAGVQEYNHEEGSGSFLANSKLCEVFLEEGDREKAQQYFLAAVKEAPDLLYLVKLFADLNPNVNGKDFLASMLKIFPFSNPIKIRQYMSVLYDRRHIATYELIKCYHVNIEPEIQTWVDMVEHNYDLAAKRWEQITELKPFAKRDLLMLSFIRNEFLIARFKGDFGLREKEWKWWKKFIEQGIDDGTELSGDSEELWTWLCGDIVQLQEFEWLEKLVNNTNNAKLRYLIAKELSNRGFVELALEIIVESKHQKDNKLIYTLVSHILMQLGQFDDAIYYAEQVYKIENSYNNAYVLLSLLQKAGSLDRGESLLNNLKTNGIKSRWLDGLVS
ncbi:glycosyltransferase [Paenibacillus sp. CAA11]|uniref:glycosyltransferase n=1 Tax=Paenibacillus sp. CAA11 TaxID=1532905 RepID=UPI00131EE8C4|nr:glycosyltransferase [Paenibacillus sp. CAA11]